MRMRASKARLGISFSDVKCDTTATTIFVFQIKECSIPEGILQYADKEKKATKFHQNSFLSPFWTLFQILFSSDQN